MDREAARQQMCDDDGRRGRHDSHMGDDLEQPHQTLVERVRGYPKREAARVTILAEIEAQAGRCAKVQAREER
jgi:hypothetical protein